MAEGKQFTCPVCGWTMTTPKGEEDLMKHVGMHKEDFHADMEMTPDQVASLVKTVNIPEPMKQKMM
jgi:predicted small metal-binding protein